MPGASGRSVRVAVPAVRADVAASGLRREVPVLARIDRLDLLEERVEVDSPPAAPRALDLDVVRESVDIDLVRVGGQLHDVGAVREAADAIGPARLRQVPPALSVAPGSGRVVLAAARGNRIVTRVRFADEAKWRQRLLPVERGVTMTALVGAADARGGAVLAWVATTRTEERLRFARLAAAPEAARPRVTRRAVTASVSSPIPGRARLVGRYRVRGQSVIGCRSAAVSLTANVPRNARCVLTARARADRAVRALRIDIAVTVRPRTGRPISATTTVAVPRRR